MKCIGKRFLFGVVAAICATVTTVMLEYDGEIYLKLMGMVTGIYVIGQSITDYKKEG